MLKRHNAIIIVAASMIAAVSAYGQCSRAVMEQAWYDMVTASGGLLSISSDLDQDAIWDVDELGCFGEGCEYGYFSEALEAAWLSNVAQANIDCGSMNDIIPGFNDVIGYLTAIGTYLQCDGDDDVVELIDFFAAIGGGPGSGGDLSNYNTSHGEEAFQHALACIGLAPRYIEVSGPMSMLDDTSTSFMATTYDDTFGTGDVIPETHSFCSSNESVLRHVGDGQFQATNPGEAFVIVHGDTTAVRAAVSVTVASNLALPGATAMVIGVLVGVIVTIGAARVKR